MSSGPRKRLAPQKQSPELLVFGYEVRYFQNPTMAAEIEAERHLIRCQGREDLLVDRYDVRLLLDDLDQHTRALPVMPQLSEREKIEEAQLDVARYEDMEAADARLLEEEAKKRETASGGFRMVPHKYESEQAPATEVDSFPKAQEVPPPVENFLPPFSVLPGLVLPATARIHQIIDSTAKFVQKQGEQVEVRLRLQHKDNPSFSFLFIDDPLHPYYKFVRTLISEGVETAIPPPPPLPPPPAAAAAVTPPPKFINPAPEQRPEIVPPPEQKAVIDTLVEMVIKHGEEFAMTVKQRESTNPRFLFLQPTHIWHSYYQKQLKLSKPATAPPSATGLALLAAYGNDDEVEATPPIPPAPQQQVTSQSDEQETLKKKRLERAKLFAAKLAAEQASTTL